MQPDTNSSKESENLQKVIVDDLMEQNFTIGKGESYVWLVSLPEDISSGILQVNSEDNHIRAKNNL